MKCAILVAFLEAGVAGFGLRLAGAGSFAQHADERAKTHDGSIALRSERAPTSHEKHDAA